MKIKTNINKLNPQHAEYDAEIFDLATHLVVGLGILPTTDGVESEYEAPNDFIDLVMADKLEAKGVKIKNFPLWIEITSKTAKNTFGVKNEDGELLTWEEWKLDNHTFMERGGKLFVGANAHTNEDMDFADLKPARAKLKTAKELPANEVII